MRDLRSLPTSYRGCQIESQIEHEKCITAVAIANRHANYNSTAMHLIHCILVARHHMCVRVRKSDTHLCVGKND